MEGARGKDARGGTHRLGGPACRGGGGRRSIAVRGFSKSEGPHPSSLPFLPFLPTLCYSVHLQAALYMQCVETVLSQGPVEEAQGADGAVLVGHLHQRVHGKVRLAVVGHGWRGHRVEVHELEAGRREDETHDEARGLDV